MKGHAGRWCLSLAKAASAAPASPGGCRRGCLRGSATSGGWLGGLRLIFPALQGVLLGTAPLGCVEITFCCSCTGREELVLLGSFGSPPFCFFLFTKAAAARWLSWPSAPQGESSLFRKLVPGARSSQVAHAPGTPVSSVRFYSCPLAFSLFGERGVVWKIIILFFFSFWHSGCLNRGRRREALLCLFPAVGDVRVSSLFVLSVHLQLPLG